MQTVFIMIPMQYFRIFSSVRRNPAKNWSGFLLVSLARSQVPPNGSVRPAWDAVNEVNTLKIASVTTDEPSAP